MTTYQELMSPHDRANNRRLDQLERNPLWDVTHADHTNEYPQPDPIDGHIPDYQAQSVFGDTLIGETEQCGDHSQHAQSQRETFGRDAARTPDRQFELTEYGCEADHHVNREVGIDVDFDLDLGFDDSRRSTSEKSNSSGLLDLFDGF